MVENYTFTWACMYTLGHSALYAGPLSPTAPRVHMTCWTIHAEDAEPEPTRVQFGKVSRHDHTKNVALLREHGDSPSRWKHLETAWRFRTDNKLCAGAWTVFVGLPQAEIDNFEVRTFAVVALVPFRAMFEEVFFSSFLRNRQDWVEQVLGRNSICPRKTALATEGTQRKFWQFQDSVSACGKHCAGMHASLVTECRRACRHEASVPKYEGRFAQVTSRCLFRTMPCRFVSSLSSAPTITQPVFSTPFHPHAHLAFLTRLHSQFLSTLSCTATINRNVPEKLPCQEVAVAWTLA